MRTATVRITSGELHPYLKDVILWGGIHEKHFVIYGSHSKDEDKFYKGIFFKTVEEVKRYWEEFGDMTLCIKHGEYEELSEAEIDALAIEAARKGQWHLAEDIVEKLGGE